MRWSITAVAALAVAAVLASCATTDSSDDALSSEDYERLACSGFQVAMGTIMGAADAATEAEAGEQIEDVIETLDEAGVDAFAGGHDELGTALAELSVEVERLGNPMDEIERVEQMCS